LLGGKAHSGKDFLRRKELGNGAEMAAIFGGKISQGGSGEENGAAAKLGGISEAEHD